jgi:hypothetical protein
MGTLGTKCLLMRPELASRLCWTTQGCVMIRVVEKLTTLHSHVGENHQTVKQMLNTALIDIRSRVSIKTFITRSPMLRSQDLPCSAS